MFRGKARVFRTCCVRAQRMWFQPENCRCVWMRCLVCTRFVKNAVKTIFRLTVMAGEAMLPGVEHGDSAFIADLLR